MGNKPIVKASALAMGLGALLATTAVAATAGAASAGADVQAEPGRNKDKSRRICRNLTPSGSRLTRRLCRTQAEWDQSQEGAQDSLLKTQLGSGTTYEQMPLPR